jgi:hypothetical protein
MPETEDMAPRSAHEEHPRKSRRGRGSTKRRRHGAGGRSRAAVSFPKHSILKCLRIPQAVLEQNAGKECKDREAAKFAGLGYTGQVGVEISSAIKYGLFERPAPGTVKPTDLVRRIVRPQKPNDRRDSLREAVLHAPVISDVYKHYRGENLPDLTFLKNTARDTFHIPDENIEGFVTVFIDTLDEAGLLEQVGDKRRILDVAHAAEAGAPVLDADQQLKKVSKGLSLQSTDTCFVMMPFAEPLGTYYSSVYEPAIKKAGLTAVRADTDIYGTGKIIDQIWSGINSANVLVAELTKRNPNVLYELGLAHALRKPVVLVSSYLFTVVEPFA